MGKLEFAWNWCTLSSFHQFSVTPTWWWMKVKGLTHTHHIFKTVDSKPGTRFWSTWRVWVEDRCKAPRKGSCLTTRRPYNTFDILSCWLLHIHAYPHGISADSTDRGQLRCKPFEAGSITWIWVAAFGETGDWFEVGDLDFCGIHFPYICHKFSMVVLADKRLLVLNCSFPSVLVMIIQIDLSLILVQFFGMIQRVDLRSL